MYANVDSLANKVQELKFRINDTYSKPHIIALTEIKHKNKWNIDISELQIEGYTIYSNNLQDNGRGIVNYVRRDIICQQIYVDNSFNEYLLLQLQLKNKSKVLIGTIYRSPNSLSDNDSKLFGFIDNFSLFSNKYKLLLGDFNCPNINWDLWSSSNAFELKFLDKLRKNMLFQFVNTPTRSRGKDTPHILDLIISDGNFIENIEHEAPLGKSDHSLLLIECDLKDEMAKRSLTEKYALSKGDYNSLRDCLTCIDWEDMLNPHKSNIDDMWNVFKTTIENNIDLHIPKVRNFSSFKKEQWTRPLDPQLRAKIAKKTQTMDTVYGNTKCYCA